LHDAALRWVLIHLVDLASGPDLAKPGARMREIAAISAMWALFKLKRRRGDRMQEASGGPLNGNAQAA
jgi:hypothetical protein